MTGRRLAAAALLLLGVALLVRAHRLGVRPYHHDEAIHGYDAWLIARVYTQGFDHQHTYNPTYHGPLRYYLTAAVFAVLGDGDVQGRWLTVAFGVILVGLPLAFRRELGNRTALLLAALLCASPLQIYYSRFLRDDPLMVVFTGLFFGLTYRGLRERRLLPAVLGAGSLGLAFCTMENAYIVALTFAASVVAMGAFQALCRAGGPGGGWRIGPLPRLRLLLRHGRDVALDSPAMVQGLLWLLAFASFNLLGALMTDLDPWTRALSAGGLVASIGAVAAAALLSHVQRFPSTHELSALWAALRAPLAGSAAFAVPFLVCYTNAFVHPRRLGAGLFSALEYWTGQQAKPRLDGPFLYYVPLLLLHEPVVFLVPLASALRGLTALLKVLLGMLLAGALTVGIGGGHFHLTAAIDDVTRQAFAGRGPLDLVAALALVLAFLRQAYQAHLRRAPVHAFAWLWALLAFLLYAWAREKVPWLGVHVALPFALLTAQLLDAMGARRRALLLALALALAAHSRWLQVRTGECNTADPIVYVQTVPSLHPVLDRVHRLLAGGRRLVLQSDVCVPFYWYFRREGAVYPEKIERVDPLSVVITKKGAEGAAASFPRKTFYYYHSEVHAWATTGMGLTGLAELCDWLPAYLLWRDQTPFWKGGYQASLMVDPVVVVTPDGP